MQPTLYRMYDQFDRLLYVGRTINPVDRLHAHRLGKDWWDDILEIRLESFATQDELVDAELIAIQTEHPIYNIIGDSLRMKIADIGKQIDEINGSPFGTSLRSIYWCYWPPEMCTPHDFEMVYSIAKRDLEVRRLIKNGISITEAFDRVEMSSA